MTYPVQADGTYTFTLDGYDATGASVGTASMRVTIDTTAAPAPKWPGSGVTHQVQIVSTNTRNPSATGTKVDCDAILALK
jgi:hypothetical protein